MHRLLAAWARMLPGAWLLFDAVTERLQTQLMRQARGAPTLASATVRGAFNLASAQARTSAAWRLRRTWAAPRPLLVGAGLAGLGLLIFGTAWALDRDERPRAAPCCAACAAPGRPGRMPGSATEDDSDPCQGRKCAPVPRRRERTKLAARRSSPIRYQPFRPFRSWPALAALTACAALALTSGASAVPQTAPAVAPAAAACTNASKLAGWSTTRLAMLTIAVPVSETSPGQVASEVAQGAGGVLLFGSTAPSNLGAQLAALRSHVPGRLGLLVMTDEEGGGIQRMANLVGSLPWARTMATNWTTAQIQAAVRAVAVKMAADGVNMDLAPVADVDGRSVLPSASNPDGLRSFSGSTATVSKDTVAYMNGLRSGGVIPVIKHFPGLGHASYNTDDGPAHTLPWSTEQSVAIPPFKAAIAVGAPAVMTSNASVPGLATNPGSISPTLISYELRGKLGFHGLVLTDSLTAKAISAAGWSVPGAAVQALRSGADMVLFGLVSNPQAETNAIASRIVSAVSSGQLSRARLIDAAGHILAVRHVNLCG